MRSKIIVLSRDATEEQRNSITLALRATNVGWWHWFQEGWLVVDPMCRSASWWRAVVNKAAPGLHVLVIQSTGQLDWAAFGSTAHFAWLTQVGWNLPD